MTRFAAAQNTQPKHRPKHPNCLGFLFEPEISGFLSFAGWRSVAQCHYQFSNSESARSVVAPSSASEARYPPIEVESTLFQGITRP